MFTDVTTADPATVVIRGRARFTVLTDRLIRLEYADDGNFEDRPTLAVCNRRLPPAAFRTGQEDDGTLRIDTGAVVLRYRDDGHAFSSENLSVTFTVAGSPGVWRPGMSASGNLGGTLRTLDGMDGPLKREHEPHGPTGRWTHRPLGRGLLSRDGWAIHDDSCTVVLDAGQTGDDRLWPTARPAGHRQDWYLFAYGHDYQAALGDGARIFGAQPLPPRYALGYWYSRYWAYTDREIEELVAQFDAMDIPLDVMVIDMDWHRIGWTGYSWCEHYFPEPQAHLEWLKHRGLKIALNLHPACGVGEHEDMHEAMVAALGQDHVDRLVAAHGLAEQVRHKYLKFYGKDADNYHHVPFDITDPAYMRAYFEVLHRPHEADGVDIWWMDWQQGESTAVPGLDTLPWINQLHWEDQERNPAKAHLRPLCFSRFGGLGAGRYPIGFSGDTFITWQSLAYQPRFTATSANVLYGYWSHDIGGHFGGRNTPELYTRWMQFGVYSPILRTHGCKTPDTERRVFEYPSPYQWILRDCIRHRYELVPYIYGEDRKGFDTGVACLRPMYYEWPECDEAYTADGQYRFGDAYIVAPVTRPCDPVDEMAAVTVWLPPGRWFDVAHGAVLTGGGWTTRRYRIDEIPVFARAGTIVPGQQPVRRLEPGSYRDLIFTVYPGGDGRGELYEDDGISTAYRDGAAARIVVTQATTATGRSVTLHPSSGDFAGFTPVRSLELRLPGSVPATEVTVDGRCLDWQRDLDTEGWTWDGDTATTIVRIAECDVTRGCMVRIAEDQGVRPRRVDGLAGLMRRLIAIGRLVAEASPPGTLFVDERFAVHLAQTGNRIGHDPLRARQELDALHRDLELLPANLDTYLAIYRRERPGRSGIAALERARALVTSTLDQFS
ncbi:MAG: TIM-barrel domain-containing protein [Planctomycetota bacterium]